MRVVLFSISLLFACGCASWSPSPYRYNYYENRFETTKQTDVLKYNIYEKTWSYESPDSELRWNYRENRWEFSK